MSIDESLISRTALLNDQDLDAPCPFVFCDEQSHSN